MLTDVIEIKMDQLHNEVSSLQRQGYRFVTLTCLDGGEAHEVIYHFDKQWQLCHIRLFVPKGESIPSISNLYFAALLAENEMKDLFGINVTGLAIDYQGRFVLSENAPKAPLNKTHPGIGVDARVKEPVAKDAVKEGTK